MPLQPNGVIIQYVIQRKLGAASTAVAVVAEVPAAPDFNHTWTYMDETLQPYTQYEYRVGAQTSAGLTYSPWAAVTTRPASQ